MKNTFLGARFEKEFADRKQDIKDKLI